MILRKRPLYISSNNKISGLGFATVIDILERHCLRRLHVICYASVKCGSGISVINNFLVPNINSVTLSCQRQTKSNIGFISMLL